VPGGSKKLLFPKLTDQGDMPLRPERVMEIGGVSNILVMADTVYRDSRRLEAILAHFGIPDVKIEGDDEGRPL
jgi:hypothetical protein